MFSIYDSGVDQSHSSNAEYCRYCTYGEVHSRCLPRGNICFIPLIILGVRRQSPHAVKPDKLAAKIFSALGVHSICWQPFNFVAYNHILACVHTREP